MKGLLRFVGSVFVLMAIAPVGQCGSFVNFETAPVHPMALSMDGRILAVCNLPDNRLELFDVSSNLPTPLGDVPVGLDPVSVRFRTSNEVWVVNHISSSISIVDLTRRHVIATLATGAGPADIIFAGSPQRAYVSCAKEDSVEVFDQVTRQVVTNLSIDGDRPKAMAASSDGSKVYVAIFESGNGSTLLTSNVLLHPAGPYRGLLPVPNDGASLRPPLYLNPNFAPETYTNLQPDSLIVKKSAAGRWMDDNHGDWTEFISGTNSAVSGRPPGWDMPDHDVAVIDTETFGLTYATRLMNLCMDIAVNPASGKIAVVGTDGTNERRFEPNLRGTFIHVNLAFVKPLSLEKTIIDLNPHLDYSTSSVPHAMRDLSIGDPRGIIWNAAGTRGYITGMGSRNLVVIDADGNRVNSHPVELEEGPTGLALDEARQRLYVLNRFSASISVLDTTTLAVVTNLAFFDPTPPAIKVGRKHLYDTRRNSGLGQLACGSCHVDARFDRLAWDLGNPAADMTIIPGSGGLFHPMKGPLVTLTLQNVIVPPEQVTLLPLHWRGDRPGIETFNITFTDLLASDAQLTTNQMQEFKDFLSTISFPPNRFRNFDNSLPTSLPLPGFFGVDTNGVPDRTPLPNGDALAGSVRFAEETFNGKFQLTIGSCTTCHNQVDGRGLEGDFLHVERDGGRLFRPAPLRSIADKLGMNRLSTSSRAGFGLRFDGRDDTLTALFANVFQVTNNQTIADMTAFLLAFPGDSHAAIGKQVTISTLGGDPLVTKMVELAREHVFDLVVRGSQGGMGRSWVFFDRESHDGIGLFQSDRNTEVLGLEELLTLPGPGAEMTFTAVPQGTGFRIGLDRDDDGVYDRSELDTGLDPADPLSRGSNTAPRLDQYVYFVAHPGMTLRASVHASDPDLPGQNLTYRFYPGPPPGASMNPTNGFFTWTVPALSEEFPSIWVQVTDNGTPPMSDLQFIPARIVPFRVLRLERNASVPGTLVVCTSVPGVRYRLQFKDRIEADAWIDTASTASGAGGEIQLLDSAATEARQRFYRVEVVE